MSAVPVKELQPLGVAEIEVAEPKRRPPAWDLSQPPELTYLSVGGNILYLVVNHRDPVPPG